jgi:hypothetical protein
MYVSMLYRDNFRFEFPCAERIDNNTQTYRSHIRSYSSSSYSRIYTHAMSLLFSSKTSTARPSYASDGLAPNSDGDPSLNSANSITSTVVSSRPVSENKKRKAFSETQQVEDAKTKKVKVGSRFKVEI